MYEFDLKKYFDTINLYYWKEMLLKLHPSALVSHFIRWSWTYQINSKESRYTSETPFEEGNDYHYYVPNKYVSLNGSSAWSKRVTIL